MNRAQWEASQLPCREDFGWWFSGLVDGEGCFYISPRPHGFMCGFTIKLRADDGAVLKNIAYELGIGVLGAGVHSGPAVNGKPWATWSVSKKAHLIRLTEVLDAFPLRTKKARDYAIWREAAIYWANSCQPVEWGPVIEAFEALKAVRVFEAADDEGITPIETAPLLGFRGNRAGFPSEGGRHG